MRCARGSMSKMAVATTNAALNPAAFDRRGVQPKMK
jgi:hypothetical protein